MSGCSYFSGGLGSKASVVKPPCTFCAGNHGVWLCKKFQNSATEAIWNVAGEKHLCFRCLDNDHFVEVCPRSKICNIIGCKGNHHHLLHDTPPATPTEEIQSSISPEDDPTNYKSVNKESRNEALSLRTVPVWLKAGQCKVKVNAILDDASNETS